MNQTPRKSVGLPLNPAGPDTVGKNGHGVASAMAQIAQDRVAAARAAPLTAEEQIRGLWRLRVPEGRPIDGLWTLRTWLFENAPELLKDKGYSDARSHARDKCGVDHYDAPSGHTGRAEDQVRPVDHKLSLHEPLTLLREQSDRAALGRTTTTQRTVEWRRFQADRSAVNDADQ